MSLPGSGLPMQRLPNGLLLEPKRRPSVRLNSTRESGVAAEARADRVEEDRRQMELRVLGVINMISGLGAAGAFWVVAAVIGVGILFGLPETFPSAPWLRYLAWFAVIVLAGFTFANQIWG